MDEPDFNWEPHHSEQHLTSNSKTSEKLPPFDKEDIFLTVEAVNIGDVLTLPKAPNDEKKKASFSYATMSKQFGTDNCATHHICSDLSLFVEPPGEIGNIRVRGIPEHTITAL